MLPRNEKKESQKSLCFIHVIFMELTHTMATAKASARQLSSNKII